MADSVIRAVVVSCKGGVPIARLNTDYKEIVGSDIPFKEGGHNNLQQYLLSINGITIEDGLVKATSEKTKHLENLISQQKDKNTRKREPYKKKQYGGKNIRPHSQNNYGSQKSAMPPLVSNGPRFHAPHAYNNYYKPTNNYRQKYHHDKENIRLPSQNYGHQKKAMPPPVSDVTRSRFIPPSNVTLYPHKYYKTTNTSNIYQNVFNITNFKEPYMRYWSREYTDYLIRGEAFVYTITNDQCMSNN